MGTAKVPLQNSRHYGSTALDDRARRSCRNGSAQGHSLSVFGKEPEYVISPGTYDQKHIARIGLLHDCIAYGPGILDLAHRPDEYVGIEDMIEFSQSDGSWPESATVRFDLMGDAE